jgi:hypothetical protein
LRTLTLQRELAFLLALPLKRKLSLTLFLNPAFFFAAAFEHKLALAFFGLALLAFAFERQLPLTFGVDALAFGFQCAQALGFHTRTFGIGAGPLFFYRLGAQQCRFFHPAERRPVFLFTCGRGTQLRFRLACFGGLARDPFALLALAALAFLPRQSFLLLAREPLLFFDLSAFLRLACKPFAFCASSLRGLSFFRKTLCFRCRTRLFFAPRSFDRDPLPFGFFRRPFALGFFRRSRTLCRFVRRRCCGLSVIGRFRQHAGRDEHIAALGRFRRDVGCLFRAVAFNREFHVRFARHRLVWRENLDFISLGVEFCGEGQRVFLAAADDAGQRHLIVLSEIWDCRRAAVT